MIAPEGGVQLVLDLPDDSDSIEDKEFYLFSKFMAANVNGKSTKEHMRFQLLFKMCTDMLKTDKGINHAFKKAIEAWNAEPRLEFKNILVQLNGH